MPNLWTFNFTQYQGQHAASGSLKASTGNFEIPWDSTGWMEFLWNQNEIPILDFTGILWDPIEIPVFSVGFSSLSPDEITVEFPAGTLLRSHVGFASIPPGIPVTFSRWNTSWNFTEIPLGIPDKFSMGMYISWTNLLFLRNL